MGEIMAKKNNKGMKEKLNATLEKLKKDEQLNKTVNWLWDHRLALFVGALMFLGLIFSFYYVHIGGFLVGLSLGLAFFEEIQGYILKLRHLYPANGLFKTLMLIGGALYLLVAVPIFLIAVVIGCAIRYLIKWFKKKG